MKNISAPIPSKATGTIPRLSQAYLPSILYLYRLAPDKLLMVNPIFQDRLNAKGIQGILTSLSLSPEQSIIAPAFAPHEPVIAAACAGK